MRELAPVIAQLAAKAASGSGTDETPLLGGKPHQVVLVPLKAPVTVGSVLMGLPLDNELVADMRSLSALSMTLLTRAGDAETWRVALTSEPADRAAGFAEAIVVARPRCRDALGHLRQRRIRRAREMADAFGAGACLALDRRSRAPAADRLGTSDYNTLMEGLKRADEIGHLAHAFEQMRVNVGEKQTQTQILELAYRGSLTGLPNRMPFRDALRDAISQSQAQAQAEGAANPTVAVIMLDLDRFKHVNGVLGYSVGHLLLGRIGERLRSDEFAVLLLRSAEIAMYSVKRRTHGPLMYDASIDATSTQTLSLLTELRRAVDQGELRLYLQPKLMRDSSRVGGAEALMRWLHPTRGLVPPLEFIPFAEQTGFIRTLTIWVFEAVACHWLALQAEGISLVLSVNLSTRDLHDPALPRKFDALLVKHRVPAETFGLEITESAIMDDPQRALTTLNKLSGLGFKLSIDDFGTGYSPLACLKRLPVDELKIDKSFVMNMVEDLDDAKIVRTTIDLAHNLGLTVVAEGVENAKVWDALRDLDCDEARGCHMGQPMPAAEFNAWSIAWLAKNRPRSAAHSALMLH